MNVIHDQRSVKKIFLFLWLACLVGSWSVIPYIQYLGILPASVSISQMLLLGTLQAAILYGLICFLSYKLFSKTDLNPFPNKNHLKKTVFFGVIFGWLYWSKGLWAAMTAHFVADLMIHVFL